MIDPIHPLHCHQGCSQGAGPSRHSVHRKRYGQNDNAESEPSDPPFSRRRGNLTWKKTSQLAIMLTMVSLLSTLHVFAQEENFIKQNRKSDETSFPTTSESIASLIKKRKDLLERDFTAAKNLQEFQVNVSPPRSCEPIQIVFSTLGGMPPFTVFIGFDNWFSYSTSLPSTYADPDVKTWLYEFNVPNFANNPPFPATPEMFVIVGDSTGKLLNTSMFQTVQTSNRGCQMANVPLDFTFWTSNNSNVCSEIQVNWQSTSNTSVTFKAPMDLYLIPQQQPPLHIGVPNITALTLNTTLSVEPGSPYMFAMTDDDGIGGVSGYNIVGLNEYEGQNCLISSTLTQGMPTPTATVGPDVRMPDYSGLVASLVTTNGVVSTATSVEIVQDGSIKGPDLAAGQIAGLSVGVAIGAGILAAALSWYLWRKRHGRKTVFWDLPTGSNGGLGKSEYGAPIDRNYLRSVNSPPSSTFNRVAPAPLLSSSSRSEASDEREHVRDMVQSDRSFRGASNTVQNLNDRTSSGYNTFASSGSGRFNSPPSTEQSDSPSRTGFEAFNTIRSSSMSESSTSGNPFVHANNTMSSTTSQQHFNNSPRNHRPHSEGREGNISTVSNALPLIETRFLGNQSRQPNSDSTYSSNGDPRSEAQFTNGGVGGSNSLRNSSGTEMVSNNSLGSNANRNSRGPAQILQHSDAGLLMDDSLDDEELMGRIELPPSYHQISRPGNRDVHRPTSASRAGQSTQNSNANTQGSRQDGYNSETQQEDEREFWLSGDSN